MNFTQIVAQVVSNTDRPDLGFTADGGDNQIPNAVLSSTLSLHLSEFFWRDIVVSDVVFDEAAYIQTLDIRAIPRFRSLAYFRKWDNTFNASQLDPTSLPPMFDGLSTVNADQALKMLQVVDLGGLFDEYGIEKQDVCYAAGDTIFIKSSTSVPMGKLGYYAFPYLDVDNNGTAYSSWIAELFPWAIIYSAEHYISSSTGDLDKARELVRPRPPRGGGLGGLLTEQRILLHMSNIEAVGR
jgi:hypothetical protein